MPPLSSDSTGVQTQLNEIRHIGREIVAKHSDLKHVNWTAARLMEASHTGLDALLGLGFVDQGII
ncbi:unnamed protein product [Protopolystoma xenopodis]|uniref:Uncharacterized protein n=1 Tax=Protopolystoma xenopodis TaxID=117903 RepID=A0A448X6U0_9PLAT|nr:unnamed protein product [Protopolystoma xenopodis]